MKKIAFLVLGIILISFCLSSTHSSASYDETTVDRWIETTYKIDFVNMTTMNISATFAVHEIQTGIDVFPVATADDIRSNYNNTLGQKIINETMIEIDRAFNETINTTFANDTVISEDTVFDESSLVDTWEPTEDRYQSPINFTKNATVTFNVTSFGFEENLKLNLDDVLRGTLKMGAVINKTFDLKADAGYKNTFILIFSDDFKPTSMTDEDFLDTTVTWTVDNLKAAGLSDSISISKSLIIESSSPNPTAKEEVLTNLTINMYDFDELYLYGTIDIKSVNVTKYNISFPEEYIKNLSFVSSDGIRMALDNGLVEWKDVEREVNNITKDVEETLSSTFNTTITLNFTWYNLKGYNISGMGSDPPINATFIALNETNSSKIKPNLFGDFDAETITGILNAGAKYSFEISAGEQNYTTKMILPENMIFSGYSEKVKPGIVEDRNAYSWNSSETLSCTLKSSIAKEYNESRALLNVLIDMHELNIFSMALNVDLNADAQIYRIELSNVDMPENLTMKYINSDCLRLLYDKGIIKQSDIDNITDEIKKSLEENLTNAFGGNVSISVYIDNDSLKGYDVDNMGDNRPVKISAEAHISISLEQASSSKSSTQAMSLSFLTFPLEFPLSGMEGFNTTYKIILPKGINVIQATDTLGRLEHGTTKDGRTYLTVTLNETEEDMISITIDATGLILNIMLPFIILSVIMTVAGVVVKLMRRKEGKLE
jgi:hypothetical protein